MKLEDLFEAMSIADVSIAKAKRKDDDYIIVHAVDGVKYELLFYPANSSAAKFAGAKDNMWAFTFRIAPKPSAKQAAGKIDSDAAKDFKMQNFNKGLEFKVMPIMMGYIADFMKKKKPEAFMFAADKGEASRSSLYKKLIHRYGPKLDELGYRVMTDAEAHMDGTKDLKPFIFVRKSLLQKDKA